MSHDLESAGASNVNPPQLLHQEVYSPELSEQELEMWRGIAQDHDELFRQLPRITTGDGVEFNDRYGATQARMYGDYCLLEFSELKITGCDRMTATRVLIEGARSKGKNHLVFPEPIFATDKFYVSRYVPKGRELTNEEARGLFRELDGLWKQARSNVRRGIVLDPMIERNAYVGADGRFVIADPVVDASLTFKLIQQRKST